MLDGVGRRMDVPGRSLTKCFYDHGFLCAAFLFGGRCLTVLLLLLGGGVGRRLVDRGSEQVERGLEGCGWSEIERRFGPRSD
jgi:hypothetical protein